MTVKDHFLKLRAALTLYYQGSETLEAAMRPMPNDVEYGPYINVLAERFSRKLVHGGRFVVGAWVDIFSFQLKESQNKVLGGRGVLLIVFFAFCFPRKSSDASRM